MSKLYEGDNPNVDKSKNYLVGSILLAIPVFLYFFGFMIHKVYFAGIGHFLPIIIFGIPSSIMFKKYRILQTGLNGENDTVNILKSLDENYNVFKNVHIYVDGKEIEIDTIVVGNNGVFIIEVKNHNGTIEGNGNEDIWIQHKVGRKGGRYTKKIKNSIKQAKYQTFMLSKFLKSKNINVWIESMVYFSNKKVISRISNAEKVFLNSYDLLNYIKKHTPKKLLNEIEINNIISNLKQ